MKVWLDDERREPEGWVRARTSAEAITLLISGSVVEISLDHDLGDDAAGTGYDVVAWIERAVFERGFQPPTIYVHSANPPARKRMLAAVEAIQRLAAVPQYEADDGPLTDEQHAAIDRAVQSTAGSVRITKSLFTDASEIDETRGTQPKTEGDQSVLSQEILRLADVSAETRAYLLSRGPIFYEDEARFPGEITREWPDGRREIVRRDNDGKIVVVRVVGGSEKQS